MPQAELPHLVFSDPAPDCSGICVYTWQHAGGFYGTSAYLLSAGATALEGKYPKEI